MLDIDLQGIATSTEFEHIFHTRARECITQSLHLSLSREVVQPIDQIVAEPRLWVEKALELLSTDRHEEHGSEPHSRHLAVLFDNFDRSDPKVQEHALRLAAVWVEHYRRSYLLNFLIPIRPGVLDKLRPIGSVRIAPDEFYELALGKLDERELELPEFDNRSARVLPVEIEGGHLSAAHQSPSERQELENLHSKLVREAHRLERRGVLANISPDLALAIRDYLLALSSEYDALDSISLGLEGMLLSEKFKGARVTLQSDFPEEVAMVSALLVAHELLVARLPQWREFLAEAVELGGIAGSAADMVQSSIEEIAREWSQDERVIDAEIPTRIRRLLAVARKGSSDADFAATRAVEDVIHGVLDYARDGVVGGVAQAKPDLQKIVRVVLTGAVIAALTAIAAQVPWLSGLIDAGLAWLTLLRSIPG